jgi:hypothetical protein
MAACLLACLLKYKKKGHTKVKWKMNKMKGRNRDLTDCEFQTRQIEYGIRRGEL